MRLATLGSVLLLSLGLALGGAAVARPYGYGDGYRGHDREVRSCEAGLFRHRRLVDRFRARASARYRREARERACERALERCRGALYSRRGYRSRGHCEVLR